MQNDPRPEVLRAIRRAADLGMTHLDTAEMYGSGQVEEIVGGAIRASRERGVVALKELPSNAGYGGMIRACERSLKRPGTDYLDLYLLHWREDGPLEPTFRAFERFRRQGRIRYWAVSDSASYRYRNRICGIWIACSRWGLPARRR